MARSGEIEGPPLINNGVGGMAQPLNSLRHHMELQISWPSRTIGEVQSSHLCQHSFGLRQFNPDI